MKLRGLLVAVATSLVVACTMEPRYERPRASIPPTWMTPVPGSSTQQLVASASTSFHAQAEASTIGWADFFPDPFLRRALQLMMERRPDLQIAILNIQAAEDQYKIQRADLFPRLTGTAVHADSRYPPNVFNFGGTGPAESTPGSTGTGGSIFHFNQVGIGITAYELDFFGRIRSLDHQKLAQFMAYEQTKVAVTLSLVAEVANAYVIYLGHEADFRLTQQTLANQERAYKLLQAGVEYGTVNALQIGQAEEALQQARTNMADYQRLLSQDVSTFTTLTGGPLPGEMPVQKDLDHWDLVEDLVPGVPSEVLSRRPDVRAAEDNLIAANANIGAARAAFFPSITLTAAYGTASTDLSGLFQGGSDSWNFSPQLNLPIFKGGSNVANLDLAKVQKNVYIQQYEKTLQAAFKETADALVARSFLNQQVAAQDALVQAAQRTYTVAQLRFQNGIDSYLNVLDAERTLYNSQQGSVAVRVARLQNLITLYKALGGGWKEGTDPHRAGGAAPALKMSSAVAAEH